MVNVSIGNKMHCVHFHSSLQLFVVSTITRAITKLDFRSGKSSWPFQINPPQSRAQNIPIISTEITILTVLMQGTFAGLWRIRLCQLLFDKEMKVFVADGEDFDARLTPLDSWNTGTRFWLERSLPPYLKCPQSIIYRCWKSDPHWFLLAQRVIASIRYDTLLRETRGVPALRQTPQTL